MSGEMSRNVSHKPLTELEQKLAAIEHLKNESKVHETHRVTASVESVVEGQNGNHKELKSVVRGDNTLSVNHGADLSMMMESIALSTKIMSLDDIDDSMLDIGDGRGCEELTDYLVERQNFGYLHYMSEEYEQNSEKYPR